MPIPKFHEIMLPLLQLYSDNQIHHRKEFFETISNQFRLTEQEKSETVKSGQLRLWDRISWAQTFLKTGQLLESPKRGYYKLTQKGQNILAMNLTDLTPDKIKELYPEVMETKFWNPDLRDGENKKEFLDTIVLKDTTPDESLDTILNQKESLVKQDILVSINRLTPRQFETLVVKILEQWVMALQL